MRLLLPFLFLLIPVHVICQELPPIINFDPTMYNAGNQNWMVSQADNKNIYIANGTGLLEYTGAQWNLYPIPNKTIIRSVKVVGNRIFTGAYMEFGVWEENEAGILEYTSLLPKLPKPVHEGEQFWHIIHIDDFIVFQSFNNIYKFNLNTNQISEVVSSNNLITNLFNVSGEIYFYVLRKGLFTIKSGISQLVIAENLIPRTDIVHISGDSQQLHIIGRNGNFYIWNGAEFRQYNLQLSQKLKGISIFSALNLFKGAYLIGTMGDGLYYITAQGKVKYHFNQQNGLLNNKVLSLFLDTDGNIWAGLDNGISVINLNSPYTLFQDLYGKIGAVYASIQVKDFLYLGTNQGLYYRKLDEEQFNLIKGTNGQVWNLQLIDNILFCGHNTGTFIVEGGKAEKIANYSGTWTIKKLKGAPNYYIQGHYNGISLLKNGKNGISFGPMLEGFPYSSKFIIPEADGDIWIGNEHKGVFKIRLNDSLNIISEIKNYAFPEISGITSSIFKLNDTLYYSAKDKILQYDQKKDDFVENSKLAQVIEPLDRQTGKIISEAENKIWGFSKEVVFNVGIDHLTADYKLNAVYLSKGSRNITQGYENIGFLNNGIKLLGVARGYLKFDKAEYNLTNPEIRIDKISKSALDKTSQTISLAPTDPFHYKTNNISFSFSIPEYKKFLVPEYSYRLSGLSPQWGAWTTAPIAHFKNLSFGDYQFQVKGRIGDEVTPPVSYGFQIARPWYFGNLALVFYFFLFLLLLFLIHQIYKRRHKKLLDENDKALRMKNLEAEQIITKLQNEQLEKEMDGKNKELAVSTMSLIKKNEFLINIKEELIKSSESSGIKSVIKTIEKDISGEDNWNFFKEAFENADKDFFKKIKINHPNLTSNDLKLCAYLRLNLSSKEIAPLLNISIKSVEIKRYRLRKKMDLDRKTNLTDYIFEL